MADQSPNQPGSSSQESAADAMLRAAQEAISGLSDLNADTTAAGAGPLDELTRLALEAGAEEAGAADSKKAATAAAAAAKAVPLPMPELEGKLSASQMHALELLSDVNLHVKIELGRTRMLVEDVLRLSEGAVVELDKLAGDPVDVYVNDRHVAKGEVLVLNDNFCVRINEIVVQAVPGSPAGKKGVA
jgi:flagellar motor switch protein FliN/FliY